jgi:hypothetical protein
MPNIKEKVRAVKTKTKAVVGAKVKKVGTLAKQEARGASVNARQRVADMQDDNTLGYVKRQGRVSARRAERVKRSYERNISSPTAPKYKGENLPGSKRKAIRTINESLNTKLQGRERKKLAKAYYADLKSKPKTMEEMRKQNKKKSKQASKCIPGGKGNNLCLPQGRNNEGGF